MQAISVGWKNFQHRLDRVAGRVNCMFEVATFDSFILNFHPYAGGSYKLYAPNGMDKWIRKFAKLVLKRVKLFECWSFSKFFYFIRQIHRQKWRYFLETASIHWHSIEKGISYLMSRHKKKKTKRTMVDHVTAIKQSDAVCIWIVVVQLTADCSITSDSPNPFFHFFFLLKSEAQKSTQKPKNLQSASTKNYKSEHGISTQCVHKWQKEKSNESRIEVKLTFILDHN